MSPWIRVVRESLGLTQAQAADHAAVSQAEWSRWEKGLREPSDQQLEAMAAALGVTAGTLRSEARVAQPVHRTQRREGRTVLKVIDGRLEIARFALERLVAGVDLDDPPFRFPSSDDVLHADPEEAAAMIRTVWRVGPGPLPEVCELIETAGGIVARADFGADVADAAYSRLSSGQRWFWLNTRAASDGARARFSLAHELGHALLHADRFDRPTSMDAERQAHRFASALLLPPAEMHRVIGGRLPALAELQSIARVWKVSVQALVTRCSQLEAVPASQVTRFWRQLNARRMRAAALVLIPLEEPRLLADIMASHREDHGLTDEDLAHVAGLPLERLHDLFPDLFPQAPGRRLRLMN